MFIKTERTACVNNNFLLLVIKDPHVYNHSKYDVVFIVH